MITFSKYYSLLQEDNSEFWDTLNYKYEDSDDDHKLIFFNKNGAVGYIEWSKDDGEVEKIYVGEPYRRMGVGTYIWETSTEWAEEHGLEPPAHSSKRSYEGDVFAKYIGGDIPELTDDIDGWTSR